MINKADKRKAVNEYTPPARKGGGGPKKSTMEYLHDLKASGKEWQARMEREAAAESVRLEALTEARAAEEKIRLEALRKLEIQAAQQLRDEQDRALALKMETLRNQQEAAQFMNSLMSI